MGRTRPKVPNLIKTTEEEVEKYKNFILKDDELLATKTTLNYKITEEINPRTNKVVKVTSREVISRDEDSLTFPLKEVSKEELLTYRKSKIPSLVIKRDGKLYHTEIPSDMSFIGAHIFKKPHQCAYGIYV